MKKPNIVTTVLIIIAVVLAGIFYIFARAGLEQAIHHTSDPFSPLEQKLQAEVLTLFDEATATKVKKQFAFYNTQEKRISRNKDTVYHTTYKGKIPEDLILDNNAGRHTAKITFEVDGQTFKATFIILDGDMLAQSISPNVKAYLGTDKIKILEKTKD